jgi:ribonuclease P protein component
MMKAERLARRREFEAVFTGGRTWANDLVALRVLPNGSKSNRYGFAVGKRLGGAVVRNRVKRRMREVVRLTLVRSGWDMVFIARKTAAETDYHALRKATEELLARAQLLADGSG